MFVNDRNSADKLRAKRSLLSLWVALTALIGTITIVAGMVTPSLAAQAVDPITTSAIAAAPISQASDRIFVIALVTAGFFTMAAGGVLLTLSSIRDSAPRKLRH
ncbi:hypothetical protein G6L28_10020 [Agrobacterium larrymoorei]|uniref:hypothetical protein n=1 Tax=Agrobacterium larrymoorei TaxID=160699 RepID=UPI001571761B|nr:hypothetical protein [Agrobacterium larrymoorei]NTJ42929.1 hypothetical protein [Agrobacterium larrymoorei]